MDQDGYPEESELQKIKEWDYKDIPNLMLYVEERWQYADSGYFKVVPHKGRDEYHLSTAGWSGNESIIEALHENLMFWSLCWMKSERGGHYVFEIRALKEN